MKRMTMKKLEDMLRLCMNEVTLSGSKAKDSAEFAEQVIWARLVVDLDHAGLCMERRYRNRRVSLKGASRGK